MSGADLFGPDVDALLARQLDAAGMIPSDPVRVEVPVHVAAAAVWQAIARPGQHVDQGAAPARVPLALAAQPLGGHKVGVGSRGHPRMLPAPGRAGENG